MTPHNTITLEIIDIYIYIYIYHNVFYFSLFVPSKCNEIKEATHPNHQKQELRKVGRVGEEGKEKSPINLFKHIRSPHLKHRRNAPQLKYSRNPQLKQRRNPQLKHTYSRRQNIFITRSLLQK